jgi:putative PIN family toxin of toxin-antitoxin system
VRVIVDTNVLVSGVFFGGVPGRILSAWSAGEIVLVLSPDILEEYRRVGQELARQRPSVGAAFEPILTLITMHAVIVDVPPLAAPVSDDPDDDKFLAAAVASETPLIVSGDGDLLRVTGWRGIDVLTPRQFVERHLASND